MKNSKIKNFIEKLQNLPDNKKKIILWVIVAILGIIMAYFWINSAAKRLDEIGKTVKIPEIQIPQTENNK